MPRRLDISFIVQSFRERGFVLLETVYLNNRQKLRFFCTAGQHEHYITWSDFKSGRRCGKCINRHLTIDDVVKRFDAAGFSLLENEYINNKQKLRFRCSVGHLHSLSLRDFSSGVRCGVCEGKHLSCSFKIKSFEEFGYQVISLSKRDREVSKLLCPEGHSCFISRDNFIRNVRRCGVCAGKCIKISDLKVEFFNKGLRLLSDVYVNNRVPLVFQCLEKKHIHSITLSNFRNGQGCGRCIDKVSRPEKEILSEILNCFVEVSYSSSDRSVIPPYELDLFFPEKNLAIEYCGLYWHQSGKANKDKYYHYNKMIRCNNKGIRLITIFEDEYLHNKSLVLSRIKTILKNPKHPIYFINKNVLVSDLRWDFMDSLSVYEGLGFHLVKECEPQASYFYPNSYSRFSFIKGEPNAGCIYNCGIRVFKKKIL